MMNARRAAWLTLLLVSNAFPAPVTPRSKVSPAKPSPSSSSQPASAERTPVQDWLRGMSLRDKVAQMVVVSCFGEDPYSRSKQFRDYVHYVRDLHVGGFIVVNRVVGGTVRNAEPHAMASFLNRMQRISKVPLMMGADFERGASMRVSGTAKFPHLMAYGAAHDPHLTRQLGAATAREARALGIHWVFAPDTDVNNNPDNPIINTRSFGENPALVAEHAKAFIEGAHSDPARRILVTAKHFPGHGDTAVDSHMNLPVLNADRDRINTVELEPFRAAIAAGADAVMSAHLSVPAIDPDGLPATVSSKILTGVLRRELGFKGLAVTDAMDMQGLTRQFPSGEAAVRAVEAGADVLLMPADPEAVINALSAAVRKGRLTEKRITESATRILMAKGRIGLQRGKLVDIEQISEVIDSPELAAAAQLAADRAVTLVRNEKNLVPLAKPASACYWILAESRYGVGGRKMLEDLRQRSRDFRVMLLDPDMPGMEIDNLLSQSSVCDTHVVAAFVSAGASRGNISLPPIYEKFLEQIKKGAAPAVLVALGSPYLLRSWPDAPASLATFSSAQTSETAAVKALLGEIPIGGLLPITIPGVARAGEGITVAAK